MRFPTSIEKIDIAKLFGEYSYSLPGKQKVTDTSKLMIIYGDNGTGKTTLLRLTYSLLALPGDSRKTYLAKTVFKELRILLNDGTSILAKRDAPTNGPYQFRIEKGGRAVFKRDVDTDQEGKVRGPLTDIHAEIERLGLSYYFLSDDRKLQLSEIESSRDEYSALRQRLASKPTSDVSQNSTIALIGAIDHVDRWLRRRTYAARRASDDSYDSLYLQVISSVAHDLDPKSTNLANIFAQLDSLTSRNAMFDQYGLSSPLHLDPLKDALNNAPNERLPIATHVAQLYIDSITTRLDKLQQVRDEFALIQETFSSYLSNKQVSLHFVNGLRIRTQSGVRLNPSDLSSGERHLVLLLCNVIVARDTPSVFIIDEPELSLNIKWQRRLISTLLEFSRGSSTQFVLATHSLELLAQFDTHVLRLESAQ